MSIIADTLKRLQTQSEGPSTQSPDRLSARPVFNKGEGSARHRKDSPFGFLIVMVGMTITLSGLALAAFLIGGYLDFGLAPDTQASLNNHRSTPITPHLSNDPVSTDHLSATLEEAVPDLIQSPSPPTISGKEEQRWPTSSDLSDSSPSLPSSSQTERTRSPIEREPDTSSSTNVIKSRVPHNEQNIPLTIEPPIENKEKSPLTLLEDSEEPSTINVSPELPSATTNLLNIDSTIADQTDESEAINSFAATLEEEIVQTEELVQTELSSTNSTDSNKNLAALQKTPMSVKPKRFSRQPSPANPLPHAQQLIQAGKYEDAVALLSPIFNDPPVTWQPWFWMGTALLGKGDMEQADQFFLSGLARNDKVPQLWIQRALVAQQRGDYQQAIHELRQAESLEADLPHIHLNLGYAYERLGNDRLANQYYGKFLKLSEGKSAFFSTRKKLFARLTQQTPRNKPSISSSPEP